MLAKYNLYVGGKYETDYVAYGNSATELQDENMRAYIVNQNLQNGVVSFSNFYANSSYSGNVIEGYVNNYINKLNGLNAGLNSTGGLLKKADVERIVNNNVGLGIENISSHANSLGYDWLYSTSYWLETSYNMYSVWNITNDGKIQFDAVCPFGGACNKGHRYGVRPVIKISSELL